MRDTIGNALSIPTPISIQTGQKQHLPNETPKSLQTNIFQEIERETDQERSRDRQRKTERETDRQSRVPTAVDQQNSMIFP